MRVDANVLTRATTPVPTTTPTLKTSAGHGGVPLTAAQKHKQLTDQTAKWVSQVFFGQMLKQMRDSPFKDKLFSGGRGGEAFQQMADQHTADSMARGTGHRLVDNIVRHIEGSAATRAHAVKVAAAARHAAAARLESHDRGVA